jgi:hypothetical protein
MTPEQSALLSKAHDSVRAAKLLSDARLYDFAVSRAYSAMFYVAEAFLVGVGLSFSRQAAATTLSRCTLFDALHRPGWRVSQLGGYRYQGFGLYQSVLRCASHPSPTERGSYEPFI